MRAIQKHPLWAKAKIDRKRQKFLGYISGIFFAVALVALFDGLLAQMRTGNNELSLLPGEAITISGPAAIKNPVSGDVIIRFMPEDAPLVFNLEGFFTGYWFGSGMWRGKVEAFIDAPPGKYEMRVSFRGASAQNAQNYIFSVYENASAMRMASHSFIHRLFVVNPFILAAHAAGVALFFAIGTYYFGRKYDAALKILGLAQIWTSNGKEVTCLAPNSLSPKQGNIRMVLDSDAHIIGEAHAESWQKGKLRLQLTEAMQLPPGALICLHHPEAYK